MADYMEVLFEGTTPELNEILIAELNELNFEGFEEDEKSLKAFVPQGDYHDVGLKAIGERYNLKYKTTLIRSTNWNQVWESNFEPVVVRDFCGIRASFHGPLQNVKHEIVITPKMSFGTGHHPTTYMMIDQMSELDFRGKHVFDFGTGTGVLAILADMLGAASVLAVDHDEWSIENANENVTVNKAKNVKIRKADSAKLDQKFDIILANINRNVIEENFPLLASQLNDSGTILLSGLLNDDEKDIVTQAGKNGFFLDKKLQQKNWICLRLSTK